MTIVLLGYMGSGKTAIGKQLAATLEYPFVDLDALIEAEEKMSINQLFKTKGEIYFRKKENEILSKLLDRKELSVLALGGGTPCYGNVMQMLGDSSDVMPIYLWASLDTLTDRLFHEKETRPMISHISEKEGLNDFIRKHLFERSFYYNQAASKIKVDEKSIQDIITEIVLLLF